MKTFPIYNECQKKFIKFRKQKVKQLQSSFLSTTQIFNFVLEMLSTYSSPTDESYLNDCMPSALNYQSGIFDDLFLKAFNKSIDTYI